MNRMGKRHHHTTQGYGKGQIRCANEVRAGSPFAFVTYQTLARALAHGDKHCPTAHTRPPLLFPGFSCLKSEFILSIVEFNTVGFNMFSALGFPSDVPSPFITALPKVNMAY